MKDTDYTSNNGGFVASAEMTNLYRKGATIEYGTKVDSRKLSISYAGIPSDVSGLALGALPKIAISGVLPLCKDLAGLLPAGSALLAPSPARTARRAAPSAPAVTGPSAGRCAVGTVGTVTARSPRPWPPRPVDAAAPLCTALGGVTGTRPVSIETVNKALVTLDEKVLKPALGAVDQQALTSSAAPSPASFDAPSFLGDGAGDPGRTATARPPRSACSPARRTPRLNLPGLLGPILDNKALFPAVPGGAGAVTQVSNVVASLQAAGDTAVAAVGTQLAGLSAADQTGVLSGLKTLVAGTPIATLIDPVLTRISGQYRSFPQLKADLADAAAGTYAGTMTVTFVQK